MGSATSYTKAYIDALYSEFVTASRVNLVFDGDSQSTTGTTVAADISITSYGDNYPAQAISGVDPRTTVANVAAFGRRASQSVALAAAIVDTKYDANKRNIVLFWSGTNDLLDGVTGANVYGIIRNYHLARKAVGWRTVAFTLLPGNGDNAQRIIANDSIRANWPTFADALVDVANDVRLQTTTDTRYYADGIHLTVAGYRIVAQLTKIALVSLGLETHNHPQYDALLSNANGAGLVALGESALDSNTTAVENTALGYKAGTALTIGGFNTAVGTRSLEAAITSVQNTALGGNALRANTTASDNTAAGFNALRSNTTGAPNTAVGSSALGLNTTGSNNTACGYLALGANLIGSQNTAVGNTALRQCTGSNNTAAGYNALGVSTTGGNNAALGYECLSKATTATDNTAAGSQALSQVTTGGNNVGIGSSAGVNLVNGTFKTVVGTHNVFVGVGSSPGDASDPSSTTALGAGATVIGSGAIAIGRGAAALAAGAVAIGRDAAGNAATTAVQNEIRLGTANQPTKVTSLKMTTQPAFVAADKYLVISAAGDVHVSSLGPVS